MGKVRLKKQWSVLLPLLVYWGLVYFLIAQSLPQTDSTLVYPLDDTYIHMAMAKNFSTHGIWGVTQYGFTSSTSSPLYTFLLCLTYWLTGVHVVTALVLNLLFGTLLVFGLHQLICPILGARSTCFMLLIIILATPLAPLTVAGMEHVLHALVTLAFVHAASFLVERRDSNIPMLWTLLLAPLVAATRYEGIFLVCVVCLLLIIHRKIRPAFFIIAVAALPLIFYALVSTLHGWLPVPNSILLKGVQRFAGDLTGPLDILGVRSLRSLFSARHLLVLLCLNLVVLLGNSSSRKALKSRLSFINLAFIGTCLLHLQFARTGWFYRYEAYLLPLGFLGVAFALPDVWNRIKQSGRLGAERFQVGFAAIVLAVIATGPLVDRATDSLQDTPRAMVDRYLEHIQPASFLSTYYPRATVVVNDIGAVTFLTECRILDMYGLGSLEPLNFRMGAGEYTKDDLRDWASREGAELAILQVQWSEVRSRIPDEWIQVSEWSIPRNVVFGDTRIGIFALEPGGVARLSDAITHFSQLIPRDLKITALGEEAEPNT